MGILRSDLPDMTAEQVFEYLYDYRLTRLLEQGAKRGLAQADAIARAIITLWKLDRFAEKR